MSGFMEGFVVGVGVFLKAVSRIVS